MFFERQVTAGTIFDEILVTDSLEEAQKFAEDTWAAKKDKEKEAHEELKKKKKEEEEVSRRAVEINPLQTFRLLFVRGFDWLKLFAASSCGPFVGDDGVWKREGDCD